jgi:hypothetical protein
MQDTVRRAGTHLFLRAVSAIREMLIVSVRRAQHHDVLEATLNGSGKEKGNDFS